MGSWSIPFLSVLLLFCQACSHNSEIGKDIDTDPEVILVDIGDVVPDVEIEKVITVRNGLNVARYADFLSADCGCIEKRMSSPYLAANGSAELSVKFKSLSIRGPFSHRVFLKFVDGGSKVFVLGGTVGAWFNTSVPAIDFGRVGRGDTSTKELAVLVREGSVGTSPISKLNLKDATIVSEYVEENKLVLTLRFSPNAKTELGVNSGEVLISWPEPNRTIQIPCSAEVCADWIASPSNVFLGILNCRDIEILESEVSIKSIRNIEGIDFSRFRIEQDVGPSLSVELTPGLDAIKLRINTASLSKGRIAGKVVLFDQLGEVLVIPVDGFVE